MLLPPMIPTRLRHPACRAKAALVAFGAAGLLGLLGPVPATAADHAQPIARSAARAATHTVRLPDGGLYRGPLRGGKLHGQGRIDWDGGRSYVGTFVDGYMQGHGKLTGPGYVYVGQFKRGNLHGKGKISRGDNYTYEGDFSQNRMQGHGKLTYAKGFSFEGQFKNDTPQGKGRQTYGDGSVVEGTFDEDLMPQGPVVITSANGDRYEGPSMGNTPYGEGVLTRADKAVVRGQFNVGTPSSKNTITYADGAVYTGQVVGNRAYGQGELRRPNGEVYRGRFARDQFDGPGQLTRADGTVQAGHWRAGSYSGTAGDGTLDDSPELAARNNQAVLYNQSALLQKQFDQLQASAPGAPRIYALYVAGDGRQEVFRREVAYVDSLFAQRFDTRGRSVSLVNSRSSTDKLPLATAHSIELALNALAGKMDRERDLLFVFLTSHGSETHELSLDMSRMALPDLPAAQLGTLLKATGIRNQVVVVSACYSGGFVPALQGERTWVITAARADRTSFGCADDNEFTYFGRALFKDSMASAATLTDAFEQARKLVGEWETRDEDKAKADAKAASATTGARSAGRGAPKLERSEPMSVVSPAFQAEVDALWRARAPGTPAATAAQP